MTTVAITKKNAFFSHDSVGIFFDKFGVLLIMWCVLSLSVMTVVSSGVSACS
jgi:hypothetical protein